MIGSLGADRYLRIRKAIRHDQSDGQTAAGRQVS
jgi:hypothetical protein